MAIIGISRDYGVNPSVVRIISTDNLSTITETGYLTAQTQNIYNINGGPFQFAPSDMVLVYYNTSAPYYTGGSFIFATLNATFTTLVTFFSPSGEYLQIANNLSDVASVSESVANLDLTNSTTPTANLIPRWDANKNLSANNFLSGYTTTATAAGTTTLTVGSTYQQFFTGTTTQTVALPVTSTLVLGQSFLVVNNSTGNVTVNSSGGNAVQVMAPGTVLLVTCILTTGTIAASWNAEYSNNTPLTLPLSLANGGTGANLTANNGGIFYSNATTGAILSGTATAGLALLSGANMAPTWSTSPPITQVKVTTFTTGTNTFTKSAGSQFIDVQLQGPGAGSGGAAGTTGQTGSSGGGGGGGYSRKLYTSTLLGATATVVLGAVGAAGASGDNAGGNSGASSFTPAGAGATLSIGASPGGSGSPSTTTITNANGGEPISTATGGDINVPGGFGGQGIVINGSLSFAVAGLGGYSFLGGLSVNYANSTTVSGIANSYGSGAPGVCSITNSNITGLAGSAGICIITEYISI